MHSKAQVSLEYLLVLAAGLAILAALLPLLGGVYVAGLFALDSVNAKAFALSLQESADSMYFQADGASAFFEANPLTEWAVSSSGNSLFISVRGPGAREKSFEVRFPNEVRLPRALITGHKTFLMKKASGIVLLEYG